MSDMLNLKRLGPNKWRIRFKYTDTLTGKMKIYQETMDGTLDEARARRDEAKVECRRGRRNEPAAKARTPLRSYTRSFMTNRVQRGGGRRGRPLRKATLERDALAIRNHILPACGDWLVDEIEFEDLDSLIDDWCELERPGGGLYSPATINKWLKVLRLYLRFAFKQAGRNASMIDDLKPLPVDHTTQKGTALMPKEVHRLLEQVEADFLPYYAMVFLGFTTGARFSELSALHWEDVDESAGVIHFGHSQYHGQRNRLNKAGRHVAAALLPEMAEVLRQHRRRLIESQHPGLATGIVFPARIDPEESVHNGYMQRYTLNKVLGQACEAAGVRRITPHDMRRTFDTQLLQAGISAHLLQAMTGHSTDEMTIHYAHIHPEQKAEALAPLIRAISGVGVNEG